jgi:hypothetical protein
LEESFMFSSHTNSQMFRGFLTSQKLTSQKIQQPHHRPRTASRKDYVRRLRHPPITDGDEPHNDENEMPQQF